MQVAKVHSIRDIPNSRSIKETEFVAENFPTKEIQTLMVSLRNSDRHLRKKKHQFYTNSSRKFKRREC